MKKVFKNLFLIIIFIINLLSFLSIYQVFKDLFTQKFDELDVYFMCIAPVLFFLSGYCIGYIKFEWKQKIEVTPGLDQLLFFLSEILYLRLQYYFEKRKSGGSFFMWYEYRRKREREYRDHLYDSKVCTTDDKKPSSL